MKKRFISLLSAVALIPAFSASAVTGSGTAADPYLIATAADLCGMHDLVKAGQMTYFVQTADIDMTGVDTYTAPVGSDGATYNFPLNYDGAFHVIKNFAPKNDKWGNPDCYAQSVFGVFSGELKNLGIVDINISAASGRAGAISGYLGQSSAGVPVTKVSNVYVTGKITGGSSNYTGGLFGTTGTAVEISNCYVNVEMVGNGGLNGLLAGRLNHQTTITNCYVAGNVSNANLVCAANNGATTLDGFVVFATGSETLGLTNTDGVTLANTEDTKATGISEVEGWAYFSAAAEGLPVLSWAAATNDAALRLVWNTGQIAGLVGKWTGTAPNWGTPDAIKATSNPRAMTARNGKMYTINQMTMAISEVTGQGLKDVYVLPKPADETDFYGTAISVDEAGNFLVGMNFTQRPNSSLKWAVYVPGSGLKEFTLPIPADWNIGRVDYAGRIIGDLTKEAYFAVVPESGAYTRSIRLIKVTGDGTQATAMEDVTTVPVEECNTQQSVAHPAYFTLAEAQANNAVNDFYYSSCTGANNYYASYVGGTLTSNFAKDMLYSTYASNNGFDTFVTGGKRYFVRNYSKEAAYSLNIVVMDENGDAVATWEYPDFVSDGGNSSLIAEPLADGTVNIYSYYYGNTGGDGFMVNFDPAKAGEPVKPEIPAGIDAETPYKISTPDDLVNLAAAVKYNPFYVALENDIDMDGVAYTAIDNNGTAIHFDGQQHVIKNLNIAANGGNAGLFVNFIGSIRNVGLVDVEVVNTGWGCTGALTGYVSGEAVIENSFATGTAGTSFYGGGLVAGLNNNAKLTMRNCYANVNISAKTNSAGRAGGLVGPCNAGATLVVENCVAYGTVTAAATAGGIVEGTTADASITLNNVVAWNKAISGVTIDAVCVSGTATITNASVWEGVSGVTVTDGKTAAELQALVTAWEGFNDNLNNGYPVLAWQEANGVSEIVIPGSKEYPYALSTPEDLASIASKLNVGYTYFTVENDIDMEGKPYVTPINGDNYEGRYIVIDGKQHVISNLTINDNTGLVGGFIGILQGEIRNLGLENISVSHHWGAGAIGGMTGHTSYAEFSVIDNCFITGTAETTGAAYAGAIGGYNNGRLRVTNSYVNVDVKGGDYGTAGIVGWSAGGTTELSNVYVAGEINGKLAAGIAYGDGSISMNNVAVISGNITGTTAAFATVGDGITVQETNVIISDETLVNGTAVENATAKDETIKTIMTWEGFNAKEVNADNKMPILAWQKGIRAGVSEDNPLVIATAEDLVAMNSNLIPDGYTYIVIDNDIDMKDVSYPAPDRDLIAKVHLDGRNHVISNLKIVADFAGIFGQLDGSVKNLGFKNAEITANPWGGAGAIAGYMGCNEPATVENCFVTGYVKGYYAGGLASGTKAGITINGCYSTADIEAANGGIAGGLLGTICFPNSATNTTVNVSNSYASGSIMGLSAGGGLVGSNQTYAHPETKDTEILNLTDVAAFNPVVNATTAGPFIAIDATVPVVLNATNAVYSNEMTINNELVTEGTAPDSMIKTVMGWEAFNSEEVDAETGMPILAWQSGKKLDQSAISEIEAAEDAPAVYYNLQGVQVTNPENGIYIVRRGNKVTKELVK